MRNKATYLLFAAMVSAPLVACTPAQQVRGYVPNEERLALLKPGAQTSSQVQALLGSPSSIATFPERKKTWYYVTKKTEKYSVFDEKTLEHKVVALDFDQTDRLTSVRSYGKEDVREVEPVARSTPTRGKELTILGQLFGNIGRFVKEEE